GGIPVVHSHWIGLGRLSIEAGRLGAVAYLDKPLFIDNLLELVRKYGGGESSTPSLGHEITIGPDTPRKLKSGNASEQHGYAIERWANLVTFVAQSERDVSTVADWARMAGHAPATICARGGAAGALAGVSLGFAVDLRLW